MFDVDRGPTYNVSVFAQPGRSRLFLHSDVECVELALWFAYSGGGRPVDLRGATQRYLCKISIPGTILKESKASP